MNELLEVKWADPDCLFQARGLNTTTVVPVLTLDAIEAWLKQSYGTFPDYWSDERINGHVNAIVELLIQVQAMKEGTR